MPDDKAKGPGPGHGDIPVVCLRSGIVMIVNRAAVLPDGLDTLQEVVALILEKGTAARFRGRPCPDCAGSPSLCEYRPLVGPLYVPRN